jgi:hypothetical protein
VVADLTAGRPTASDSKIVKLKPVGTGPAYVIARVQGRPRRQVQLHARCHAGPGARPGRAAQICEIMLLQQLLEGKNVLDFAFRYGDCSRILQRAEELRKRRRPPTSVTAARAGRCRVAAVPLRGARRGPASVRVSCTRTAQGLQVTLRARRRGRALRSVLGSRPRLIVGRGRETPALPGDRLNVLRLR